MRILFSILLSLQFVSLQCADVLDSKPETTSLESYLKTAHPGDYIVGESGKILTILHIRSITDDYLLLEEISAPLKNMHPRPASWSEWVKNKAPGHSSWSLMKIDLHNGQVASCYSFSKNAYIQVSQKESIFATLLNLPLQPVSKDKRRRIGPPPQDGENDFRKLWQPSLKFEGRPIENPRFKVFATNWPLDGSELEGKEITLYFDEETKIPLPIWIQVETAHAIGHFRTIDSGKKLQSPMRLF